MEEACHTAAELEGLWRTVGYDVDRGSGWLGDDYTSCGALSMVHEVLFVYIQRKNRRLACVRSACCPLRVALRLGLQLVR